jgi:hypothetical protein
VAVPQQKTSNLNLRSYSVTPEQEQDLLVEWSLYSPQQKDVIMAEFRKIHPGEYSQAELLEFLKEKLGIEGYWQKIGLV